MSSKSQEVEALIGQKYRHGFVTDIESDSLPPGLDEDVVRAISLKKKEPQFLLEWRLKAFRHWRDHAGAHLGPRALQADRLPGHFLLLGAARAEECAEEHR